MKKLATIITVILINLQITNSFAQELPASLQNKDIFWFSASSLNMLSNGDEISKWEDQSGNDNHAFQSNKSYRPNVIIEGEGTINGQPTVQFTEGEKMFKINNSTQINIADICNEKTLAIFFRTSDDVNNMQVIYEEGALVRGLNLYIYKKKIYSGIWNLSNDKGNSTYFNFKDIKTSIEPNTNYMLEIVFNAQAKKLSMYLNGIFVGSKNKVGSLYAHSGGIGLGGVNGSTITHKGTISNNSFKGYIGDILLFNSALSNLELDDLEDAIGTRYGFDHTGTLPVEMINYSANLIDNTTLISWSTASEFNNDYFSIERSKDLLNWSTIGTITGAGNSNIQLDYNFTDYSTIEGTVYYRISQTDFDGTTEIFDAVTVKNNLSSPTDLSIDNIFSDSNNITIQFITQNTEPVSIKIFSTSGALINETSVNPNSGINIVNLSTNNAYGIGIIKLSQHGEFVSEKTLLR